jgi:hypothetical protein
MTKRFTQWIHPGRFGAAILNPLPRGYQNPGIQHGPKKMHANVIHVVERLGVGTLSIRRLVLRLDYQATATRVARLQAETQC